MSDSVRPHRQHSPTGSPVPGILQARTLEWVAISFSNAWKWKVKVKSLSRVWLLATPWTAAHQAPPSIRFSRQEYWNGVPLPSPPQQLGRFNYGNFLSARKGSVNKKPLYFINSSISAVGSHTLVRKRRLHGEALRCKGRSDLAGLMSRAQDPASMAIPCLQRPGLEISWCHLPERD